MNPHVAPVSRCVASFGAWQRPCPGEEFRAAFGRIFGGFLGSAEDKTGLPPKPSEAGSVGRGEATE